MPGSGLWGQNPLFFSLYFLKRKQGGQPGQRQRERTGLPSPRGAEDKVRFEGWRRWELVLPHLNNERRRHPFEVLRSRFLLAPATKAIRAGGAQGCGLRARRPLQKRLEHSAPLRDSRGPYGGNGPADPAPRPYGEINPGFAALGANANEIPLPSPLSGAARLQTVRAPGPALLGTPGPAAGSRWGAASTAGTTWQRQEPRRGRGLHGRRTGGFTLGAPDGAAAAPGPPGAVPAAGRHSPRLLHGHSPLCCYTHQPDFYEILRDSSFPPLLSPGTKLAAQRVARNTRFGSERKAVCS